MNPAWSMPMATHVDGILASARRLAARLVETECVRVAYGTYEGGSILRAQVRQVLPLPPEILRPPQAGRQVPLRQLSAEVLLRRLVGEFLLSELMLALTESFTSENVARLQIMQSATHNIEDKLNGLTRRRRQLRQEAITSELVEVIAGGEAVNSSRDPG